MLKRLLFIPVVFFSFAVLAQTGSVSGVVKDAEGGEVLIGTTVIVKGTSKGTIADLEGNFLIKDIPVGDQTIQVSFVGYETVEVGITISEGQDAKIGEVVLASEVIGLREVMVMADIVEERKTPVAISTITALDLDERFSDKSLADAIQNIPGVYTIQGAGGYGDQEVYIRGFDQTNIAFLVNGIPVNDMENGRMFWSNFAGLSQVTRTTQVQRGLGASKLAVSSIGGTVNMITKPADRSEGGRIEYQTGTGSWNNRLRFSYNTGLSDNGWAISFQGTRTTTSGLREGQPFTQQGAIIPGAYTDAWSYYISASKQINKQHTLMFWAFGAPTKRGTSWTPSDLDRQVFNIDEPFFNTALGIKDGQLFNARQNNVTKPLTALTHYWDIDENTNLSTSVYYSRARVTSVQPRVLGGSPLFLGATVDTQDGSQITNIRGFFPVRLPFMIGSNNVFTPEGLINWDYLSQQNRQPDRLRTIPFPNGDPNISSVTGYSSNYYLESRHNNHDWIGLVSNYTKQINDLRLRVGIDARYYKGEHFAQVADLMGGDFIQNHDERMENDQAGGSVFNKLDTDNAIAYKGDKTNYYYDGYVRWFSGFAQGEWVIDDFIVFGSATLTYSDMYRVGHFWYGRSDRDEEFNLTSLGKSDVRTSISYALKTGVNYKIDGRHNVYANAGYFTRPPYFRNAFFDARYSGEYREGLEDEKIASTELGYGFKTSFLKVNVNAYYLLWSDRTTTFNFENQGDQDNNVIPLSLTGMVSEHKGIEVDFVLNPTSNLELNGYLGLGDWFWKEVPSTTITRSDGVVTQFTGLDELKGLPVGTSAQTTAGVGFHYRGIKSSYIGGRVNYADRIPIRFSPEDVLQGFIDRDVIENEFNDYATVDLYLGRYFDIGESMNGRISLSVNNVLDTEYVRWANYSFDQVTRGFGYTRTYTIGLYINF